MMSHWQGVPAAQVLKDVLKLARRHEVGIDSSYAALVLGVCVIVGFATSLDNRINIMDAATSCFLQHSLTGKATGRLYWLSSNLNPQFCCEYPVEIVLDLMRMYEYFMTLAAQLYREYQR